MGGKRARPIRGAVGIADRQKMGDVPGYAVGYADPPNPSSNHRQGHLRSEHRTGLPLFSAPLLVPTLLVCSFLYAAVSAEPDASIISALFFLAVDGVERLS